MYGLVDQKQYEMLWQALMKTHPNDTYLIKHKERHYELFDHLAHFTANQEVPRVLEIGVSSFTRFYKQLLPHIEFVTLDRPLEHRDMNAYSVGMCRATHHYSLDLNKEAVSPDWGSPPIGQFDYIVFCEVLEHLVVNPIQLFEELLTLLKRDGVLYVTTPNFFAMHHLQQISRRENPQYVFPRRGEDKQAAHHFREFAMGELIQFFEQAGGKVIKACYSDVWQDDVSKKLLKDTPELFSNLLVAVTTRDSNVAIEEVVNTDIAVTTATSDNADIAYLQTEIKRLQLLVAAYENGRVMRCLKWLHQKGIIRN